MEAKDLMWAVWCVIAAGGAYKVGHFLGFKTGIELAKAAIGKALMEGKIDVREGQNATQPQAK